MAIAWNLARLFGTAFAEVVVELAKIAMGDAEHHLIGLPIAPRLLKFLTELGNTDERRLADRAWESAKRPKAATTMGIPPSSHRLP